MVAHRAATINRHHRLRRQKKCVDAKCLHRRVVCIIVIILLLILFLLSFLEKKI